MSDSISATVAGIPAIDENRAQTRKLFAATLFKWNEGRSEDVLPFKTDEVYD